MHSYLIASNKQHSLEASANVNVILIPMSKYRCVSEILNETELHD